MAQVVACALDVDMKVLLGDGDSRILFTLLTLSVILNIIVLSVVLFKVIPML